MDKTATDTVRMLLGGSERSFRLGEPRVCGSLGVCPLILDIQGEVEYITYEDALDAKTIEVGEIGEAGSVPELTVRNTGDTRVLIMDGEQLVGAKQNRVMNTTVLVDANSEIVIPVSCVEQGRWHYDGRRHMSGSRSNLYASTRANKSRQVARQLRTRGEYNSDQHEIWSDIREKMHTDSIHSPTSAMEDHFASQRDVLGEFQERLSLENFDEPGLMVGAAFTISGRILGLDAFDRTGTLERQWPKLLNSYAIEAAWDEGEGLADRSDVEEFLGLVRDAEMSTYDSPGLGTDLRAAAPGAVGGALVFEGESLHLYAFRVEENDGRSTRERTYRTPMTRLSDRIRRLEEENGR